MNLNYMLHNILNDIICFFLNHVIEIGYQEHDGEPWEVCIRCSRGRKVNQRIY